MSRRPVDRYQPASRRPREPAGEAAQGAPPAAGTRRPLPRAALLLAALLLASACSGAQGDAAAARGEPAPAGVPARSEPVAPAVPARGAGETAAAPEGARAGARPAAAPFGGRIASVADGDSFTMTDDAGRRVQIRLSGIDAPERTQPYADVSRRSLRGLLESGPLRVEPLKVDRFGRVVARVSAGGRDVGLAQVEAGLAWHFRRYQAEQAPEERAAYARAERAAREARAGLWRDPDPLAPWLFRQQRR